MELSQQQPSNTLRDAIPRALSGAEISGVAAAELSETRVVIPLAELECRAIVNALLYTGGDTTRTARLLGIGRTTLYRKINKLGLGEHRRAARLWKPPLREP